MEYLNKISGFVSIIGVIGSIIGLALWWLEKRRRLQFEADTQRRLWSDISKVKGLMENVESDLKENPHLPGALQAHGNLSFMFRDLLRESSLYETNYSIETIRLWRQSGKLSSNWQEKLALTILFTKEIDIESMGDQCELFADWDELPKNHPCYTKYFELDVENK